MTKTMRRMLLLFVTIQLLFGYSQQSEQSVPWTLEAAVEHAVKNNLQIR